MHEVTRIGLISDTHIPDRCRAWPDSLVDVFSGVDIILHAGDVGELWVLDKLSQIAPVVAVHGNDEAPDAQRELPYQQLVTIAGRRILLWHSHYPDRVDEMDSRKHNQLNMARQIQRGKRAGATIVVFGHWHIPLVYEAEGMTVINPGAIASGNSFLRQIHQTVALLDLHHDGTASVRHIDLAHPERPFVLSINFDGPFTDAFVHCNASILTPELEALWLRLRAEVVEHLTEAEQRAFYSAINRAGHLCWSGNQAFVTPLDWLAALQSTPSLADPIKQKIAHILQTA